MTSMHRDILMSVVKSNFTVDYIIKPWSHASRSAWVRYIILE